MPANPPAPRPVVSGTMSVGHVSDVSTSIELGIEQARRNEGDFLEDAPRPVSELSRNEFDEVVQRLVDGAALSVPLGERMLATYAALSRPQGRGDAALKAVLGLHGIVGDGVDAKCEGCGQPYPCQTRRAIDQLYDASLPSGRGGVSAEGMERIKEAVRAEMMRLTGCPDIIGYGDIRVSHQIIKTVLSALDGQRREGKRREGKPRPAGYELAGMPVYLDASLPEHTIRIVASDGKVLAEQSFAPEPPLLPTRTEVEQAVDAFAEAYVEVVADVFCDDARFKVLDEKRDAARSALLALIPTTETRDNG